MAMATQIRTRDGPSTTVLMPSQLSLRSGKMLTLTDTETTVLGLNPMRARAAQEVRVPTDLVARTATATDIPTGTAPGRRPTGQTLARAHPAPPAKTEAVAQTWTAMGILIRTAPGEQPTAQTPSPPTPHNGSIPTTTATVIIRHRPRLETVARRSTVIPFMTDLVAPIQTATATPTPTVDGPSVLTALTPLCPTLRSGRTLTWTVTATTPTETTPMHARHSMVRRPKRVDWDALIPTAMDTPTLTTPSPTR